MKGRWEGFLKAGSRRFHEIRGMFVREAFQGEFWKGRERGHVNALVVTVLVITNTVCLVINVLSALLDVILFNIFNVSPESPVLIVKAFPLSPPSLSHAV
jgi:hypothetical protein